MAISLEQLDAIALSIVSSDDTFFALAGAILVVMAGIWGFAQVRQLLDDREADRLNAGYQKDDDHALDNYGLDDDEGCFVHPNHFIEDGVERHFNDDGMEYISRSEAHAEGFTDEEYEVMVNGGYEAQFDRENNNEYGRGSL